MRIALVSDTYTPQVNGVTTVVERIARTLCRTGHDVAIVAPAYPGGGGGPGEALELRTIRRFLTQYAPQVLHVATEGLLGVIARRWASHAWGWRRSRPTPRVLPRSTRALPRGAVLVTQT